MYSNILILIYCYTWKDLALFGIVVKPVILQKSSCMTMTKSLGYAFVRNKSGFVGKSVDKKREMIMLYEIVMYV